MIFEGWDLVEHSAAIQSRTMTHDALVKEPHLQNTTPCWCIRPEIYLQLLDGQ